MQVFDLEPFVQYMTQRKLVPEQQIPYYVRWVKMFLTTELPPMATSPKDRIQAFSDILAHNQTVEDWQLRQALRAVELYLKVFLMLEPSTQSPAAPDDKEAQILHAEKVSAEMRDLIRLRHYSYRTEQTYLDWVSRYMRYALSHDLDWQKSDSVKAFLSSLATQHNVAAPLSRP